MEENIQFMNKVANLAFVLRLRFAWEIVKGVNPITGEPVSRGGVRDNIRGLRK